MYKLVDLFAGAGGITRGFLEVGEFEPAFAVEKDADARQSYILNFHSDHPDKVRSDVTEVPYNQYPSDIDVLVGGPPCQDFTQLTAVRKDKGRERNDLLWKHYIDLVLQLRPKVFVIENVPNLLTDAEYAPQRHELKDTLRGAGYQVEWGILNTANYGLPQSRQRAFVIGTRVEGQKPYLPFPSLHSVTAFNAISDLARVPARQSGRGKEVLSGQDLHVGRDAEVLSRLRYRYVLPEGNRSHLPGPITIKSWVNKVSGTADGYGRVFLFRPSCTIRCEGFKPEKGRFLHPVENRPLTLAEMARIQTFPDEHKFFGSYTSIGRQIGNAVPPKMARCIAMVVLSLLKGECSDIPFRPETPGELADLSQVRGHSAAQRVRSLLTLNLGQPVEWWKIEHVVRQKTGNDVVDWGTPLRELVDEGYDVQSCGPGKYKLNTPDRKQPHLRPVVQRLLAFVREDRKKCDACNNNAALHFELVRPPEQRGVLLPDNVSVLCDTCRSAQTPGELLSKGERAVYAWLAVYRHYAPVARSLFNAVGLNEHDVQPGPLPPEDAVLENLAVEAPGCDLCGCPRAADFSAEWIRPLGPAGGLKRTENAWVLCSTCRDELDSAQIKVPNPAGELDDTGRQVALRSRFAEAGFLTLKEAYYRNWLLQYGKDPVIKERARKVLVHGDWRP